MAIDLQQGLPPLVADAGVRVARPAPLPPVPSPPASPATQAPSAWWKFMLPVAVTVALALTTHPAALAQHAWWYFSIFAGVIVALMLEPLPGGAIGFIGVTLVTTLAPWVLFSPTQLAAPGFKSTAEAIRFALSGFSNTTVWLIFGAFMFALGYEKTGLGKRIALLLVKALGSRTLTLGWLQDTVQLASDDEIIRARNAVIRERPQDVRRAFAGHFRAAVAPKTAARAAPPTPLPAAPSDDPYGF